MTTYPDRVFNITYDCTRQESPNLTVSMCGVPRTVLHREDLNIYYYRRFRDIIVYGPSMPTTLAECKSKLPAFTDKGRVPNFTLNEGRQFDYPGG